MEASEETAQEDEEPVMNPTLTGAVAHDQQRTFRVRAAAERRARLVGLAPDEGYDARRHHVPLRLRAWLAGGQL
jgi:hypothetical protein